MSATEMPEIAQGCRLSPPQERFRRLREARPGAVLGAQARLAIHGPLDVSRLDAAVAGVRARHEILRTRCVLPDGHADPVQLVDAAAPGLDEHVDLRRAGARKRSSEPERLALREWQRLGGAAQAPVFSCVLVSLPRHEQVLLLTASGLSADAETLANVAREIAVAYTRPDDAEADTLQYADLSEWQNGLLETPQPDAPVRYWGAAEFVDTPFPALPFERRAAPVGVHQEAAGPGPSLLRRALPDALVAALRDSSSRSADSVEALLLAAWAVVLHRLSLAESFLIGVRLDGRPEPELQAALGPLARLLPLRLNVAAGAPLGTLVDDTRRALELARFDQLVFAWEPFGVPEPSERRHLFPLSFGVRRHPLVDPDGSPSWSMQSVFECLEPGDLSLTVVPDGPQPHVEWVFDPAVFDAADVEHVAGLYQSALAQLTRGAGGSVGELALGGTAQAEAAPRAEPAFVAVRARIEGHARRTPDAPAVVCLERSLTYGELDARAAALARRLRRAGVGREAVVAIMAERSLEYFVGLFAVLKAGGAWLPIEPDTPAERVESMLAQAGARVLLLQGGVVPPASAAALPAFPLDDHDAQGGPLDETPGAVDPRELAYVIFTSGSTGQPKGVAIEQRQLAAYLNGIHSDVDLRGSRHYAMVSTVAADLGHTSVFGALTTGGCLHVIPPVLASDADALAEHLRRSPVDFVKIVPAHLEALCTSFPEGLRLPWRCVVAGGEQLTWALVEQARRVAPDVAVLNEYGPTETTVGVTCQVADVAREPYAGPSVALGRPLTGSTLHLLDPALQPVPDWVPGELFIGGDFVGRGYIGRADLTAERFVPDPFSSRPGARMYRTGDLVRRRGDGALVFLGRRDGQVKVRGYRIELGEIEAALAAHPQVQTVAVVVAEGPPGTRQLVAWVAVGTSGLTPDALRGFLDARLPQFMVPTTIACVERLQLTSNGKIDRQALPAAPPPQARAARREPADEIEWNLLGAWRAVLGRDDVGVDDNYFALGGDSLRVIQLVHEARGRGIVIAAADVLRYQSIARLRQALQERQRRGLLRDGVPPLPPPAPETLARLPADVVDVYPLSGVQRFMVDEAARSRPEEGIYHIQECLQFSDDTFSLEALQEAFALVVERHPALRTVFDLDSDPPAQWVRRGLDWSAQVHDATGIAPEARQAWVMDALARDRARPFDVRDRDTPLFRAVIQRHSATEFDFVLSAHHAIIDGWGHRVMTNQLLEAYVELKAGRRPDLGRPDATYREFVAYQEAVRGSDEARSFWRRQLDGVPSPGLPACAPAAVEPDEPIFMEPLDARQVEAARTLARKCMVSPQAFFLSTWIHAQRLVSGDAPVVAGVVSNGRSEHLSDPLAAVGLFWNIVPFVSRRALPFGEQTRQVQHDLVELEPYAAYPLPQLIADQGGRTLFHSSFRYLHFWNERRPEEQSSLRLLDVLAYDRYSFPLDFGALISARGDNGYLIVQYRPGIVSAEHARTVLGCWRNVLCEILAGESAAPQAAAE